MQTQKKKKKRRKEGTERLETERCKERNEMCDWAFLRSGNDDILVLNTMTWVVLHCTRDTFHDM